jgi:spoIIIJ-associated protein
VLTGILGHLGATGQVDARPGDDPGSIVLEIAGDSSGLLIGRRGATLDALEYLVNRIVSRDEVVAGRITIDVEHYRQRRQEYLDSLARRLADKAKQTGRVVTLNPMSPRDRRIVHLSLQNDGQVTTRSQGDGYYRRVLILPAGRSNRAPRSPRA